MTPNKANPAMDTKVPEADGHALANDMLVRAALTTDCLKSLSHPSRLVVLCRLADGPCQVGELEALLSVPQAEVSKQLARLRADGLVTTERRGRSVIYALADGRTARIVQMLHAEFCT